MFNTGNLTELQKSLNEEEDFFTNLKSKKSSELMNTDITSGLISSKDSVVDKK